MVDMNYPNNRQFQNPGPAQGQVPPQPIRQEIPDEPKKNGWLIFTSILCIALIFTVGILAYTINVMKTQPNNQSLNLISQNTTVAFNQGVVASIIQLMKSTDSCQVASIKYYNATRQIVDINCVRQLLQQQNVTLK